ncbi:MAG: DNA repair protein RecO [Prochloraceae cyanobacterium]|nr:DNA repair protein RecO [Prochloraceae cyanobacterium]
MSRTYQASGIVLKGMPLGEADRLVTILTAEFGLVRAVAPGARKHQSKLRGKSELFVVNQLLIAKGRSLDKITQAETIQTYSGLSRDLGKLAASQYLAELVLFFALSDRPQSELYQLLNEHLRRLEKLPVQNGSQTMLLAHLTQAVFHLLVLAGIAPQVLNCCLTQKKLQPNFSDPRWRIGFSFEVGGTFTLSVNEGQSSGAIAANSSQKTERSLPKLNSQLNAVELTLLQTLGNKSIPDYSLILPPETIETSLDRAWVKVERILRDYAQYHFSRQIRSATLVDALSSLEF